jgi:hypothetical protein
MGAAQLLHQPARSLPARGKTVAAALAAAATTTR